MKKVYKYVLPGSPGDTVAVEMVSESTIVFFGLQAGQFVIWAEHEADREKERYVRRVFCVHGTGWEIESTAFYHGTALDRLGVWHLYETRM